jgi:hypothetical protein
LAGDLTGNITVAGSRTIINELVTGNVDNAGLLSGAGTVVGAATNRDAEPGNSPPSSARRLYTQTATGRWRPSGSGYDAGGRDELTRSW